MARLSAGLAPSAPATANTTTAATANPTAALSSVPPSYYLSVGDPASSPVTTASLFTRRPSQLDSGVAGRAMVDLDRGPQPPSSSSASDDTAVTAPSPSSRHSQANGLRDLDDSASSLSDVDMSVDEDDEDEEEDELEDEEGEDVSAARLRDAREGDVTMSPAPVAVKQEAGQISLGRSAATPSTNRKEPKNGQAETRSKRRTMPARLRQVSSLLAGSMLEEELLDSQQRLVENNKALLPPSARLILTNDAELVERTVTVQQGDAAAVLSIFADPEVARACRETAVIETPEFKLRDDSEAMGKTRGMRNEEDTSDAAYERRHRKPENVEKRQRKLELERLVKDRNKLKDRIDQLKAADARLLMPILTARDQQRAAAGASGGSVGDAGTGSRALRKELLDEARETLSRYDLLLPSSRSNADRKRKAALDEASGQEDSDASTPARHGRNASGSGKAYHRSGGLAKGGSPVPSTPDQTRKLAGTSASGSRASAIRRHSSGDPAASAEAKGASGRSMRIRLKRPQLDASPASDEEHSPRRTSVVNLRVSRSGAGASPTAPESPSTPSGAPKEVRPEHVFANIHARTMGGRFAPKKALGEGATGSTSTRGTKSKWPAGSSSAPTSAMAASKRRSMDRSRRDSSAPSASATASTHLPASPSPASGSLPSEAGIPPREVKEHQWGLSGQGAPLSSLRSRSKHHAGSPKRPGAPTALPTGWAKVGPTLSELRASERKPLRVKLVLGKRSASSSTPLAGATAAAAPVRRDVAGASQMMPEEDDEEDDEPPAEIVMGTALTEEEAKAMLEAALAETMAEEEQLSRTGGSPPFSTPARPGFVARPAQPLGFSASSPSASRSPASTAPPASVAAAPATPTAPATGAAAAGPARSHSHTSTLASRMPPPASPATTPATAASASASAMRRNSSRVQATSAFGEKLPAPLLARRDFDETIAPVLAKRSWRWALAARGYDALGPTSPLLPASVAALREQQRDEQRKAHEVGRRIGDGKEPASEAEAEAAGTGKGKGKGRADGHKPRGRQHAARPFQGVRLDDVVKSRERAEGQAEASRKPGGRARAKR
ncbi:uncharacterized protein PFL1_02099 [Pseudozyma flocculosa PF-1]|uniref:uncharacterized protein n=1 Tax=Pseudozyma flocculosa PF-1 TaxID=1277687 RepID=UPI0004561799|nr:uncharacterized protein PFL1_02099 [Pseudozyma flocculosa PF-1]EPQ30575.1 hypothetical protein PFL1_02099 [Pseudozyma flocculosa PF-1]